MGSFFFILIPPTKYLLSLSDVLYSYFLLNIISSTQIYLPF